MVLIVLWVFKNILTTYLRCLSFILSYLIELSKVSNRIERLSYVSITLSGLTNGKALYMQSYLDYTALAGYVRRG